MLLILLKVLTAFYCEEQNLLIKFMLVKQHILM